MSKLKIKITLFFSLLLSLNVWSKTNFEHAQACLSKDNFACAIYFYTEALGENPKDIISQHNRGYAYAECENYSDAAKDFEAVIKAKPFSSYPEYYARAFYNLGAVELNQKNYKLAEKHFLIAKEQQKDFPQSYFKLAQIYFKNSRFRLALKNFFEGLKWEIKGQAVAFKQTVEQLFTNQLAYY